jgi:putative endonuclease
MWYVYIVECSDWTLYTGITTDILRREEEHNSSEKWAKFTKIRRPVKIVFTYEIENRSQASKLEYSIKKMTRSQKLDIISGKKILLFNENLWIKK